MTDPGEERRCLLAAEVIRPDRLSAAAGVAACDEDGRERLVLPPGAQRR